MRRLALVLVLAMSISLSRGPTASAATTRRLAGPDRYATAVAVAADRWSTPSDVVLASGADPADALAGAYISGLHSSPVLLTAPDELPTVTRDALRRTEARTVHVLGGTSAIGAAVEAELETEGYAVRRYAGTDRYATAAAVARAEGAVIVGHWRSEGPTALLANGERPFDALAAGPLAAGQLFPVLLTETESLPDATRGALDDLAIAHVIVLGGTAAVSEEVVDALEASGRSVRRVAGLDRAGTAVAVAELLEELDYDLTVASLVSATSWADALGAGPWGAPDQPVLLCDTPGFCGVTTTEWARSRALDELVVVGGEAAVSDRAAMTVAAP